MTTNTHPSEQRVAEVVAGLTEAQRRAVMRGRVDRAPGFWPLFNSMRAKGLVDSPWGNITPLGLAVRTAILSNKDQ